MWRSLNYMILGRIFQENSILDKLGKLEVGDILAQGNNTKKQEEVFCTILGTEQAFQKQQLTEYQINKSIIVNMSEYI